jgi:hypothetical protein
MNSDDMTDGPEAISICPRSDALARKLTRDGLLPRKQRQESAAEMAA